MVRNSLTLRLVAASLAWIGATLLVTALLLVMLFRGHTEQHFKALLHDHLEELVAASELTSEGTLQMTWRPSDPRFRRPHSGWYWEIVQSGKSVARSESLWNERLGVTPPPVDGSAQVQKISGPENEPLQVLAQDIVFPEDDRPFLFAVAGPVAEIEGNVRAFTAQVAITLTALGVGLLLVVWLQVRFGLRPLQSMRQALGEIRSGKAQRLPGNYPIEVEPVVSELNSLLEHNQALLDRARTQVGNLAHALKSPLTVIRNEAKALENEPGRMIRAQTAAMVNSVDRCLSQARIAGAAGVIGTRTEVKAVVDDLCFSMERLYRERNLNIATSVTDGCWFRGEAQDLEEMLGNLMDNACKWARSRVRIDAGCMDDRLLILVEDDGPGIPEQRRADVLQRGRRLDESVPGTGLGLDIAQDIAGLYRGSIVLGQVPNGGLRVQLELPAAG